MNTLSILLFAVLTVIAALHAYWALGGLWPAKSEAELIRTVIGEKNFVRMPPAWMTFVVSGLVMTAAFIGLSASGALPIGWPWLARLGALGVAFVMLARGAVTYVLQDANHALLEPFATLNYRYYSPLCLALGVGFLCLAFVGRR